MVAYTKPLGNYVRSQSAKETDLLLDFRAIVSALADINGQVSSIQGGVATTFGAALDGRWFIAATGTNTLSGSPSPAPTIVSTIPTGYRFHVTVANRNTAAVTLNIGSSEGAVAVQKRNRFGVLEALEPGDLKPGLVYEFRYTGTVWLLLDPSGYKQIVSAAQMALDDTASAAPGTGTVPTMDYASATSAWVTDVSGEPLILGVAGVDYAISLHAIMSTAVFGRNVRIDTEVHIFTAAGDWSNEAADDSGVQDDFAVPANATGAFTITGADLIIPAAIVTEANMRAVIKITRGTATTLDHTGNMKLLSVQIKESA